ncbi:hypothetical protein L202_05880 [Cryptococcus amylolentus CBS 6039]|uniref:Thc1 RRM domain-containing protein n=3 Tax=Cryptococcus amylolentus TaxID=104669 RepID=A0A1E3HHR3_9TREE|nr:hypothetical protein L202_05880 [Cryptococcus amylolentus CBS 6039]ODN75892.1 hypothetical protein L202_05880 [Cryptococcus amylolentus CBS 6039]ODN97037.1 hypothetical protein I350_08016 [Cryptococcus amylolentus CBS 6273]
MSISLPNGTLLAAPSSNQVQLSAAVTRILHLANFSPELKTRDLQLMFKDWESDKGGYRIKWLDDTNALIVFADANVAKRAYLSFLLHPPSAFSGLIRPYDRPDAAAIIQSLAARSLGHRSGMSSVAHMSGQPSISGPPAPFPFPANNDPAAPQVHSRAMSVTNAHHHSKSGSISGLPGGAGAPAGGAAGGVAGAPRRAGHGRSGSASSSWGRNSISGALNGLSSGLGSLGGSAGLAGGALSFPNASSKPTLPTHDESSGGPPSRSASTSSGEAVLLVDPSARTGMRTASATGSVEGGNRPRRDSVSADKALREVQKALAATS